MLSSAAGEGVPIRGAQATAGAAGEGSTASDAAIAVRNSFKLGGSLVFTWAVAFGVRILLPRFLGPAAFGDLNFADALAATAFVLIALGVDTLIRKEGPLRLALATEIFGGLLALRLVLALAVGAGAAWAARAAGRPPAVAQLVLLFGAGQVAMSVSGTLSAVLHARGRVSGLSITNGIAKLLWGAGILVGIFTGRVLFAVPLSLALAETAKCVVLYLLARRHAGLRLRLDLAATWAALAGSLPYYVNNVAVTAYGRIDVSVLSFVIRDSREIGWYGAASNLAGLCLLVTPLIGWILMPLFARARARSEEELRRTLARSMEIVLAIAAPTALLLALGADPFVLVIFGRAFAPAALPLRILAGMFVLTYVATVSATCLNVQGRGWLVTVVSLGGLLLNPFLNVSFIGRARALLGGIPGSAGVGAALAMLVAEALVTVAMTALLGASAFDRRGLARVGRMLLSAAGTVAVDRAAAALGPARLVLDASAYLALVTLLGGVRLGEVRALLRAGWRPQSERDR